MLTSGIACCCFFTDGDDEGNLTHKVEPKTIDFFDKWLCVMEKVINRDLLFDKKETMFRTRVVIAKFLCSFCYALCAYDNYISND